MANTAFENGAKLQVLGKTVTIENCIYEEIKSELN
jgi:hypothetical protein